MFAIRSSQAVRIAGRRFNSSSSKSQVAATVTGAGGVPKPSDPKSSGSLPSLTSTPKDLQQAPNHPSTWSRSQNPRSQAMSGARFEQTDFALQPAPFSAMEAVAQDPVRMVDGRKAACDGGGGPLGHPKIFINLDKPGPKACGYCGIRFEQAHHH